jgi:hypothetical protein
MKNYALVLVAALISSNAFAGQLNRMSYSQIVASDLSRVEQLFVEDFCAATDCDVPSWAQNPDKLTSAERIALHQYSNGYYLEINPALVRNNLTGLQTGFIRTLDSGLKKIPNQKALVYRGTSQRGDIQKGDEGKIITLPPYTSTSTERDDADRFIRDRLMIIKVKAGKNIKAYANAPNEDEILLPRDTQLRVDKIEMKKLSIFTEEGPEDRLVQIVELTQI